MTGASLLQSATTRAPKAPTVLATACLPATSPVTALAESWQQTVTVYLVGASMSGEADIGSVTADVDVSFGDILDNLEFGAMLAYRAERGPWALNGDLIFLSLEQTKTGIGPAGNLAAKVEGDQLMVELDLGRALTERLEAYVGLRYWQVDADITVGGGGPLGETLAASEKENWVDPVLGLRYALPLGERWVLAGRGDIGGFGIGSDFSWHVTVYAGWRMTEQATLLLGFRYLDVDYDDGTGSDRFLWDVAEGGPTLGLAWRF